MNNLDRLRMLQKIDDDDFRELIIDLWWSSLTSDERKCLTNAGNFMAEIVMSLGGDFPPARNKVSNE